MQEVEARVLVAATEGCRTVLDLGYGSGIVAKALQAAGRSVTVVEGAMEFANIATHYVDSVIHDTFETFHIAEQYDCIIASFVLEHMADPVAVLQRLRAYSERLIVVVGNANSYHRQLAVQAGLQETIYSLSERDHAVGHYRVYDYASLMHDLELGGWSLDFDAKPNPWQGIMFKPLNNARLALLPPEIVRAMCEMPIEAEYAANLVLQCRST